MVWHSDDSDYMLQTYGEQTKQWMQYALKAQFKVPKATDLFAFSREASSKKPEGLTTIWALNAQEELVIFVWETGKTREPEGDEKALQVTLTVL